MFLFCKYTCRISYLNTSIIETIQQIINGAKKGNKKAEYELYRYCFDLLMPICARYTSDRDAAVDLLNQGFIKIIFALKKYENHPPFNFWSKRILINLAIDEYRKNKKRLDFNVRIDAESFEFTTLHTAIDDLSFKEIILLLEELPAASRIVFEMFVLDGFKHDEIAEQLNISTGTSKWHLNNARMILQKLITKTQTA